MDIKKFNQLLELTVRKVVKEELKDFKLLLLETLNESRRAQQPVAPVYPAYAPPVAAPVYAQPAPLPTGVPPTSPGLTGLQAQLAESLKTRFAGSNIHKTPPASSEYVDPLMAAMAAEQAQQPMMPPAGLPPMPQHPVNARAAAAISNSKIPANLMAMLQETAAALPPGKLAENVFAPTSV